LPVVHRTDTAFTRYVGRDVPALAHELAHLQHLDVPLGPIGLVVAAGTGRWQRAVGAGSGLQVVTVRVGWRIAGLAAGFVTDLVDVREVVLAAAVRREQPDLPGRLVEAFVDGANLPWADVVVPADADVLSHLLGAGWRAVPRDTGGGQVRLSAARAVDA
jgi:hypothetical protein